MSSRGMTHFEGVDAKVFKYKGVTITASADKISQVCGVTKVTTATATLTVSSGRVVVLNRAAGIALTLPAATGSGLDFEIIVGTTFTGDATIKTAGTNLLKGLAILSLDDTGDGSKIFETAANTNTITMNGSTKGGLAGARVRLTDVLRGVWAVELVSAASGTEATPFSASA